MREVFRNLICLYTGVWLVFYSLSTNSQEAEKVYRFNIPAQPLRQSLADLSEIVERSFLFPYDLVEKKKGNPVQGRYSAQQAIDLLLENTGFEGDLSKKKVLLIKPLSEVSKQKNNVGEIKLDNQKKSLLGAFISLFTLGPVAETVVAQDSPELNMLEEIIVTARRRDEGLQDVPLAISALSEQGIRDANIYSVEDLAAATPGLAYTNTRAFGTPIIRGLAQTNGGSIQTNVGVFMDGIYINNRSALEFGNMDIAQIDVAKGPQSALYGRDSFAGAINYVTNAPEIGENGANIQLDAGSDERAGIKASVNLGLGDSAALRVFGGYSTFDGTIENDRGGENLGGWDKRQTIGASLLVAPTDRLTINLFALQNEVEEDQPALFRQSPESNNAGAQYTNDNGTFFTLFEGDIRGVDSVSLDNRGSGNTGDLTLSYLKVAYEFDAATLTAKAGHTESSYDGFFDNVGDLAAASRPLFGPTSFGSAYFFTDSAGDAAEQTSFDLQLASNESGSFDWLAGVSYYDSSSATQLASQSTDINDFNNLIQVTDFNTKLDQEIHAAFASATFDVSDKVRLGAEIRYTEEEQNLVVLNQILNFLFFDPDFVITAADTDESVDFDYWSGRATVEFRPNDDNMFYAYVANGVKTGGINAGREGQDFFFYDPEENITYEIGSKSTLLDGKLILNTALFYVDWTDLQSTAPGNIATGQVIVNGTGASSAGIEFDATLNITDNLTWTLAATVLDPKYDDGFVDGAFEQACVEQAGAEPGSFVSSNCTGDVSGNQIAKTSKTQLYTSLTHVIPSAIGSFDIVNRVDFSHEGKRPTTSLNFAEIPSNNIFNYRLSLRSDSMDISLWVDNVFDKEWIASTLPISSTEFNNSENCSNCSIREENIYPGNGRQFGVTAAMRF